jgi:hypothetical protein
MQGRNFIESSITKKDGCTYYAINNFKVVKSTKSSYYAKRVTRDGFTITEKGKLSVWFGKSIFQVPHITDVFKHFNFNWFSDKLYGFVTKGIFEKMMSGKITNNLDLCKAYIKAMRLNCSPALFLQLFTSNEVMISKSDFLRQASVAKDINHLIEYLMNENKEVTYEKHHMFNDMIKEAQILEKKIDYTWSFNRLKEEHKKWTEEIMKVEIDSLEDVPVKNIEKYVRYTPFNFRLLTTQKEVFYEGKTMKHCVYTSYWNSIKEGRYLAYHVMLGEEEATLGMYIDNDCIRYNQCYTKYNQAISSKMHTLVKNFVDNLNDQTKRDGLLNNKQIEEKQIIVNPQLPF